MPPSPGRRVQYPGAVRSQFSDVPDNHPERSHRRPSSADGDERVRQWRRYGLAEGMRQLADERDRGGSSRAAIAAAPYPPEPPTAREIESGDLRLMRSALLQLLRDAVAANQRVHELERAVSIQAARIDELTRHVARLERG